MRQLTGSSVKVRDGFRPTNLYYSILAASHTGFHSPPGPSELMT